MPKSLIDTIHLNLVDTMSDDKIKQSSKKLPIIQLFPKLLHFFDHFSIPHEKFYLRNESLGSKYNAQLENGIFVSFKSMPPRIKGQGSDPNVKLLAIQAKGTFMLKYGFKAFQEYFKTEPTSTISKIEISYDFPEDTVFETMNIFLNHKDKIKSYKRAKTAFFFDSKNYESLLHSSNTTTLKLYDKLVELKFSGKEELYFSKNPEFKSCPSLNRLEVGYSTTKRIEELFPDLDKKIRSDSSEKEIIDMIAKEFFSNFEISKKSKIKEIIKQIKKESNEQR